VAIRRIGVIGDIHAQHERLQTALDTLRGRSVEVVVATGDIADGCGSVDACCEMLTTCRVVTVRGNHDRWLLAGTSRELPEATALSEVSPATQAFLASLPPMVELETIEGTALLCHGLGPNDMAKVGPEDFGYALESNDDLQNLLRNRYYRWILNGHSHRRMVRAFPGMTIINAGTLNPGQAPGFLEVDFAKRVVLAFEFDDNGTVRRHPKQTALE
jgi:predicted phosphodiesterase